MAARLPWAGAIATLSKMIRLFDLRDLALVHRLSDKAVCLHAESGLIEDVHPVRSALGSIWPGRQLPTYVWKADAGNANGFVQLQLREDGTQAQILCVAAEETEASEGAAGDGGDNPAAGKDPEARVSASMWLPLLDQLAAEAGSRGVQNLVAEVSEVGKALPVLRQAGFAVYTREDIWRLPQVAVGEPRQLLRARRDVDDWDINLLYANVVPRLIQLVEPTPPLDDGDIWVLREDGDLTAFVQRHDGPAAGWLRLFVHPDARVPVEDIVASGLLLRTGATGQPLYCCVPRYQSWLQGALQGMGFAHWGSYAVMVRHTVKRVQAPAPDLAAVVQAKGMPGTAPLTHPLERVGTQ